MGGQLLQALATIRGAFQGLLQSLQGLEAPCNLLLAQLSQGHLLHIQVHEGHGVLEHLLAEDVSDELLRGWVQGAGLHPLSHSPHWASIHLHHSFLGLILSLYFDKRVLARMSHKAVPLRPLVLGLFPKFLLKVLLCIF